MSEQLLAQVALWVSIVALVVNTAVFVAVAIYTKKTCKLATDSGEQLLLAKETTQMLRDDHARARSGPEITAIEPPSIVLESADGRPDGRPGKPLWVYVPLTFTNTGSTPGVVSDLRITLTVQAAPVGGEDGPITPQTWEADWPGPNDPVTMRQWEPCPIEGPAHGSAGRTVKLYVNHDRGDGPASPGDQIRKGSVTLDLEVLATDNKGQMESGSRKWAWTGKVTLQEVQRLRTAKPGNRQSRIPRMRSTSAS